MGGSDRKPRNQLLSLSSVGLMFPISIAIGYYIGSTLDKWFHTGTKMMMLFVVFGIIGAFLNLFKEVKRYNRTNESDRKDETADKETHASSDKSSGPSA
ncbi:MAG: AtpZ/AtpI family protein [Acidobacteriia bacterium]|nr:AtpZ/AtpI family protein [Terriglobia bacterium]